jgi:hypothetical protein
MPIFRLKSDLIPETYNTRLSDGVAGNIETLEIMRQVARDASRHPVVREFAKSILLKYKIKDQNYYDEAHAIGHYVKKNVRYVRDIKGVETLHDPLTMIDHIKREIAQGDCDDMALLTATLLLSIGHEPYFCLVKYHSNPNGSYQHIYTVVYEKNWRKPKQRLVLDCILKRSPLGTEVKALQKSEIKV